IFGKIRVIALGLGKVMTSAQLNCILIYICIECNNDYAPVCGSNNKNYQNECFLRRDACKQQSEVLIMSEGDCPAGMYAFLMVSLHKHALAL
uniref:Kazal-like domain-containing protein n=1 Tax=Acanthochromis polyacanthus TaxID=80966 RepID=A0A3Q1EKW8_9TELE